MSIENPSFESNPDGWYRSDAPGCTNIPIEKVGPNWYENSDRGTFDPIGPKEGADTNLPFWSDPPKPGYLTVRGCSGRQAGSTSSVDLAVGAGRVFLRAMLTMVIIGALIAAAFILAGYAKSDPSIDGVDLQGGEESYLVDIDYYAAHSERLPNDMTLLQMGYAACVAISKNKSIAGVKAAVDGVQALISTPESSEDLGVYLADSFNSGVIVGRATDYLCPQNEAIAQEWAHS
jgi:hypothetical protein